MVGGIVTNEVVRDLGADCLVEDPIELHVLVLLQLVTRLYDELIIAELEDEVLADEAQGNHVLDCLLQGG